MKCGWALLLLLLGPGALAQSGGVMGDPIGLIEGLSAQVSGSGIFAQMMTAASAIASGGFVIKLYAAWGRGGVSELRGVLIQAVGVALMLSLIPSLNTGLISAWNSAYGGASSAFSGSLVGKLDEAKASMGNLVEGTAGIALLATGGAAATAKVTGAGLKEVAGQVLQSSAGKAVLTSVGEKLGFAVLAMNGFVIAYSSIIAISGFVIVVIGYLAPLAVAFTIFGQTGPLWGLIGAGFGSLLVVATIPFLAYGAIDQAFIQPAKSADAVVQKMHAGQQSAMRAANTYANTAKAALQQAVGTCEVAQNAGESADCAAISPKSVMAQLTDKIASLLPGAVDSLVKLVMDGLNLLVHVVMQLIMSIVFFVVALAMIASVVQFVTTALGGGASYAGAVIKGRA